MRAVGLERRRVCGRVRRVRRLERRDSFKGVRPEAFSMIDLFPYISTLSLNIYRHPETSNWGTEASGMLDMQTGGVTWRRSEKKRKDEPVNDGYQRRNEGRCAAGAEGIGGEAGAEVFGVVF
jgi:hypothetical protein